MVEPRMDGTKEQQLAFRVVALREGIIEALTTDDIEAMKEFLGNALRCDDTRMQAPGDPGHVIR